jgi:RHS repeat-associated protein
MYSDRGAFHGVVRLIPDDSPTGVPERVDASATNGSYSASAWTDAGGAFDFDYWSTPEVDGVMVFGDGGDSGTGSYDLWLGPRGGPPSGEGWRQRSWSSTKSNVNTQVDLVFNTGEVEDEPRPDCEVPPSGVETPEAPPTGVGQPVNPLNGNVFFDQTDAVLPGVGRELRFVRSYNSMLLAEGQHGAFGPGWNHSYEQRLDLLRNPVTILRLRRGDGTSLYFQDTDQDGTFHPSVPPTSGSWIERLSGAVCLPASSPCYRRVFRAGGYETYEGDGRLRKITTASEVTTTLTYDTYDPPRLVSVADAGGRSLTLSYDDSGRPRQPTRLTGPAGLIATFTYTEANTLGAVTYANNDGLYTFAYHPDGRLETVTDADGVVLEHHLDDAQGRATTSARGAPPDQVELYSFAYQDFRTIVTSRRTASQAEDDVTTFEWNRVWGLRRITRVIGACASCSGSGGDTREWKYDGKGRIIEYTDGAGNVTTYTYDPATGDLLTSRRSPAPDVFHTTTYTYWPDGRVHTVTRPNGQVTTYTWAAEGPATITEQVTPTTSRLTQIAYTAQGKPWKITDPRNRLTELHWKPEGDLEWVKDPLLHQTTFQYDLMGRRTKTVLPPTTPPNDSPTLTYDTLGRLRRVTNPNASYAETTYGGDGRRATFHDAGSHQATYHYDGFGRLEAVEDSAGRVEYAYDLMSHLTGLELVGTAFQVSFEHDAHGRVTGVTYPGDLSEAYTYDAAGRLWTRTDRKGVTTTYTYDGLGRLTRKTYSGGPATPDVVYTYDAIGTVANANRGLLTSVTDNAGETLSWDYDLAGQVLTEKSTRNNSQVTYTWALDGQRASLGVGNPGQTPSNLFDHVTDGDGRLWKIRRVVGSTTTDLATFTYDPADRRRTLTYASGVVTSYTPDLLSRLATLSARKGPTVLTQIGHTYDDVDNRLTRSEPGFTDTYTYDAGTYRLNGVTRGTAFQGGYTYGPPPPGPYTLGNRERVTFPLGGGVGQSSPWVYTDRNELLNAFYRTGSTAFTYDANGNVESRVEGAYEGASEWTYEWDVENRVRRVLGNGQEMARFTYDPLGRRVEKVAGGVTRKYVYDGEDVFRMRETIGATTTTYRYVHGPGIDEPLALDGPSGIVRYYHADTLGSIVKTSNASGSATATYAYDPFGQITSGSPPDYAFTGREWDPETGLYYFRARYYDPKIGRFISEDPIGFDGGDVNLYAYVWNNPTNFVDPEGLAGSRGGPWHPPPGVHTACTPADDCSTLKGKIWLLLRMIRSHEGWDRTMPRPRGGNRHATEIAQLWIQLATCQALYTEKCLNKPTCNDECKENAKKAATAGAAAASAYIAYRCIRMIPSLFPPLWPTIPANAAAP